MVKLARGENGRLAACTFPALRYQRSVRSVRFAWDQTKHERNRRERGFGFDFAALIFEGGTLEWPDDRRNYGEGRVRAIGEADGLVLHVVFTDRADIRRIISARLADRKERHRWHESR